MNRGGKTALLVTGLALAGCAASGELNIRPIENARAKFMRGDVDLAAARGQLALGNVGLALEAFRKVNRARPAEPLALAGIADCYAAMGRFDIAQTNYEAALALAPHDATLLLGLAAVFERQGDVARALAVRAEANPVQTPAVAAAPVIQRPAETAPAAAPLMAANPFNFARVGSVTVELPKARPADRLATDTGRARAQLAQAAATAPLAFATAPVVEPAVSTPVVAQAEEPAQVSIAPIQSSITVQLPAVRPVEAVPAQAELNQAAEAMPIAEPRVAEAPAIPQAARVSTITVALPQAQPAARLAENAGQTDASLVRAAQWAALAPTVSMPLPPAEPRPRPNDDSMPAIVPDAVGPRVERVSPGEVMLVTTGRSIWRAKDSSRALAGAAVQWIPLGNARVPANVQVLNAARRQGLAGSARTVLLDRGWRRIAVGDAPQLRDRSVVLYPRSRAKLGRSLAAQFGVRSQASDGEVMVLVLGRDAIRLIKTQRNL